MSPPPSDLITSAEIAQFERDGFCVIPDLFSETEINDIEAFFEDYKRNGMAVYDEKMRFEEMDKTKQQIRAMHPHRYSEKAKAWGLHPKVTAVLEVLMGNPPLLAQTMYYFKPPGAKGQGMHQDNFYLLAKPATCMAAWTAIDAATIDNGCLYVVPESNCHDIHCPSAAEGSWRSYGDSHITPFPADVEPVPLEVPRGATVFFGGQLIHGSGPNRTPDRSRRTFIGHYVDAVTDEVADFFKPLLDRNGGEVEGIASVDGGGPCGDGWKGAAH